MLNGPQFQVFNADGGSCGLTAMEFRLLEALVKSPNCVLSREQLLDKVHDKSRTDIEYDINCPVPAFAGVIRRKSPS